MITKKWVNRFTPLLKPNSNMDEVPLNLRIKIMDLFERTVVEATGEKRMPYEEVRYITESKIFTGWIHEGDLENYMENYPRDCVLIYNKTPTPNDFEQYFLFNGIRQVNASGELCVAFVLGISLQGMLENWQVKLPVFWRRIFGGGKARGTGSGELREMFDIYARESQELSTALYEPHIKRSRYTIKGMQRLLETGSVIASVSIDSNTGLLRGSGALHWVAVTKITAERNGLGLVEVYNPAMNRIECYSWSEFINSARQPYGIYAPGFEMVNTVVLIGDSLTKGQGWAGNSSPTKPLNVRLAEKYPRMSFVNLGVGGESSVKINARKAGVDAYKPFRVIVWAGVNDVYAGTNAEVIETNLQEMYTYFSSKGYEVIALTIPPRDTDPSDRNAIRNEVNAWIKTSAISVSRVVDAFTIIADPSNPTRRLPLYMTSDPISTSHINDAGFAAIVSEI